MYFLVSHKYKFMMGWSAKCGCSSIKKWYLDIHGIPIGKLGVEIYKAIGYGNTIYTKIDWNRPEKYAEYRKYALVRSPYSRAVSGFLNKYVARSDIPNKGWSTFSEFLIALQKDRKFKRVDKHHFTPQFSEDYVAFSRSGMNFDKLIRLENLNEELAEISELIGAKTIIAPRANETSYCSLGGSYKDASGMTISELRESDLPSFEYFYNRKTAKVLNAIYRKDFNMLSMFDISYGPP